MQRQNFGADQIRAGLQVLGDGNGEKTLGVDKFFGAPFLLVRVIIIFVNVEPPIAGRLVFDGRVDLFHINGTRSFVADVDRPRDPRISPIVIFKGDDGTGLGRTHAVDPFLAVDTLDTRLDCAYHLSSSLLTTGHVVTRNSFDGVGRLVDNLAHPDAGANPLIGAIDVEVGEERVGMNDLRGGYC